jgi:putative PIN family toxin of toxin-antitoxin system
MINVVFDTNIFIDGLLAEREDCEQIIDMFGDRKYRAHFSQETIGELIYVSKIIANQEFVDVNTKTSFLHYMTNLFFFSKSINTLDIKGTLPTYCKDEFDDMFLECACAGEVDYLVTNDIKSGLHDIDCYQYKIITSDEFLKLFVN